MATDPRLFCHCMDGAEGAEQPPRCCAKSSSEMVNDPIQRSINLYLSDANGRDRRISSMHKVNGHMHGSRGSAVQHQRLYKLPHDIHVEILSWLPAKSLLRFRAVSREWDAASRHSAFALLHLSRQAGSRPCSLIVQYGYFGIHEDSTHHLVQHDHERGCTVVSELRPIKLEDYHLVGSCNGVLCLLLDTGRGQEALYVCNPLLGELSILPPPISRYWREDKLTASHGFGFVPATGEFKVARVVTDISYVQPQHEAFLELCTLPPGERWSWRTVAQLPYYQLNCLDPDFHAFVDGKLHWVARQSQEQEEEEEEYFNYVIVSFDLAEERIELLPFLESIKRQHWMNDITIAEINGCIAAMINSRIRDPGVEVWVMSEYGRKESWTRLCSLGSRIEYMNTMWTLCVSVNGDILLGDGEVLTAYDASTGRIYDYGLSGIRVFGYVPSVTSLRPGAEATPDTTSINWRPTSSVY